MALATVVLGSPLAVWAALPVGNDEPSLNRNVEPLDLPSEVKGALGVLVWVALLTALGLLLSPSGRDATRRSDVRVAIPLVVAGVYSATTYWGMTRPVSGANIGAGLMFLFGCLLVPAMIILSGIAYFKARRSSPVGAGQEAVSTRA